MRTGGLLPAFSELLRHPGPTWVHHHCELLSHGYPSAGLSKPLQKPVTFDSLNLHTRVNCEKKWLSACSGSFGTMFLHPGNAIDGDSQGREAEPAGAPGGRHSSSSISGKGAPPTPSPPPFSPIQILLHANATICTGRFVNTAGNLAGLQATTIPVRPFLPVWTWTLALILLKDTCDIATERAEHSCMEVGGSSWVGQGRTP